MSEQPKNFDLVITFFTKLDYPSEIPRMTPQERQEFVSGLLNDAVFSSMHIHAEDKLRGDLTKIFLPHAGEYFSAMPRELLNDIGVLWEFSKEKKRSYRGAITKTLYPVFTSVRLCSKLDWDLACDVIKAVKAQTSLVAMS